MGDAGSEAERGVIWVSGSLMGRLGGYLKNKKQPAPLENKVQAAFKIYIQKKYGHTTLFH